MPILDMSQNEIIHHENFPNDDDVRHIEFGASKSCFGKIEFPYCYLTDREIPTIPHFTTFADYVNENCHYLDGLCDFFSDNLNGRTFDKLIFCNPYGYGFNGREYSKEFLNKAGSLLNDNGEIFFLGNSRNGWVKYKNVDKYLKFLTEEEALEHNLELSELTELTAVHRYVTEYEFTMCDIKKVTVPDQMFIIKKIAV